MKSHMAIYVTLYLPSVSPELVLTGKGILQIRRQLVVSPFWYQRRTHISEAERLCIALMFYIAWKCRNKGSHFSSGPKVPLHDDTDLLALLANIKNIVDTDAISCRAPTTRT